MFELLLRDSHVDTCMCIIIIIIMKFIIIKEFKQSQQERVNQKPSTHSCLITPEDANHMVGIQHTVIIYHTH